MKTAIIYSKELRKYDFGEGHPFRSDRFEKFLELFKEKLGNNKDFELIENITLAADKELEIWHSKNYIDAIKSASEGGYVPDISRFISNDNVNPYTGKFPIGIDTGARAIVKNSILAIEYVQEGKVKKAVSLGGGLHHAMSAYGEGFCVYNDVVIAVKHAIKKYDLKRVLILDTDAHAGNGTCKAFYSDPNILFIDLHQSGIYPLSGYASEVGKGNGRGFTINLPLISGTSDRAYELIFDKIIFPIAKEFNPQLIIRYGGSDPHFADSLAGLGLTLDGFKMIREKVKELSIILCEGRSVDLICSGYNLDILAMVWLVLIASSGSGTLFNQEKHIAAEDMGLKEITGLIEKVKESLKPYWKSI